MKNTEIEYDKFYMKLMPGNTWSLILFVKNKYGEQKRSIKFFRVEFNDYDYFYSESAVRNLIENGLIKPISDFNEQY